MCHFWHRIMAVKDIYFVIMMHNLALVSYIYVLIGNLSATFVLNIILFLMDPLHVYFPEEIHIQLDVSKALFKNLFKVLSND